MEHKNIDRLFQEQLKNLDAIPSPKVWSAIASQLTKKKRRILPFWWFSGGVAALLVVGFLLLPFTNNNGVLPNITEEIVTSTPKNNQKIQRKKTIEKTLENKKLFEENNIANTSYKKEKLIKNSVQNTERKAAQKIILLAKKTKVSSTKTEEIKEKENLQQNNEKETDLVQKNAMKKIFTPKDSLSLKEVIKIKKEVKEKQKKKISKPKKDFITEVDKNKTQTMVNTKQSKWSISSIVASNNSLSRLGNSSNLDFGSDFTASFNPLNSVPENKETNVSYGINISYQLHKKWSFQTGIHFQKIRLSTNNIYVSTNNLTGAVSYYQENPVNNFSNFSITSSVITSDARLKKAYGYIEVPLEIKYSIFKTKRFNTQVLVGFSSLFLYKNNTIVTSSTYSKDFGKDSNLNSINFSGNLGLDFDYSLSKKWKINITPMLKKQLNTFSRTPKGFTPYFFGVYSGVNYQF